MTEILELIERHNEEVNAVLADFDLVGDDDFRERIQFLQFQLTERIKQLEK